ncbi:MAG: polysaccharide biosynthesis protein [Oscillospiraceae bacterium]|nr:polysaccharide biosynthesis protein [Oscillospiraceae bacterium]
MKRIVRMIGLIIADILTVVLSSLLAGWIRQDFNIDVYLSDYGPDLLKTVPFFALGLILISIPLNLYKSLWEYASIDELLHVCYAVVTLCAIQMILILTNAIHLPKSFPILFGLLTILFSLTIRYSYRVIRDYRKKKNYRSERKRTMLIGAGNAGMLVLREFQTSEYSQNQVVCIVDDDVQKRGSYLRNVKICGGRKDIVRLAEEYRVSEIIFAIPAAKTKDRKEILKICQSTGCRLKIMPGIFQLANGEVSIQKIREVDIMDLLGRESVEVDLGQIAGYLSGKTVLVTGGGGSIGSELCRQIAQHNPAKLIIFDIYENNAYEIQQELKRAYPDLNLITLIGSVRDTDRVQQVFDTYRPQIIFHAAAHKHVPLMEESPNEAIKNNVFGTYHVAKAAAVYNAETFVLISTDKAVNPTNIMGASKRICEMIVQMMANASSTKFVAVRFGNVLGSNGSVIPLFKKQIAEGGPVTVTHPDIIRFFMTIPEAVSLVLQAGVYANRGEIFVLDMGEPVKIDDLARNLIRLSGFEPDVDIEVKYTGLRPGEKLYEEMLMNEEGLRSTANNLIHIGKPLDINDIELAQQLVQLEKACEENDDHIRDMVEKIVPTYHRPVTVN